MDRNDLSAFHEGDETLFRTLVERYSLRLQRYIRRFTSDPDEAAELLQATWVRVYECRRTFKHRGAFEHWLLKLCRTECVTHSRRRIREQYHRAEAAAAMFGECKGESEALAEQNRYDAATDMMMALPPRQRLLVITRVMLGRSTEETARQFGCAPGTVKAGLHHAMQKLRASKRTLLPAILLIRMLDL